MKEESNVSVLQHCCRAEEWQFANSSEEISGLKMGKPSDGNDGEL